MAEEFTIRIIDEVRQSAEALGSGSGGSSAGSSGGGAGPGIGKMAGIAAGVMGAFKLLGDLVGIVSDVVGNLLAPVKGILIGIVTLIGELLRPVVEVIMLFLRPILSALKPLIDLFKTFMAPFMDIARQFGQIASTKAGAGDFGGAMEASIEGVKTLVVPFIISLTSVVLQLAISGIVGLLTTTVNLILGTISTVFGPILKWFGVNVEESIATAQTAISEGGSFITNAANSAITTGTQAVLDVLEVQAREKLATISESMPELLGTGVEETYGAIAEEAAKGSKSVVDSITGEQGIVTQVTTAVTSMDSELGLIMGENGTFPANFRAGLLDMEDALTSFVDKATSSASTIRSLDLGNGGSRSRGFSVGGSFQFGWGSGD